MSWATPLRLENLLEACIQSRCVTYGKLIHQHILKTNTQSPTHCTLLLGKLARLYIVCNKHSLARRLLDRIPHTPRNVILWNLLIRHYAWHGPFEESINLYHNMVAVGIQPTKFTFPFVLKACSALQAIEQGAEIHFHVRSLGLESDTYVSTALVDMYAKCGSLGDAKRVFDEMPVRDVVAWNSMIAGLSLYGNRYDQTMDLLLRMQENVIPNSSSIVGVLPAVAQANALRHGKEIHGFCVRRRHIDDVLVGTGILDMYGKCQCIHYARRIFDMMGIGKNEVTWSAMIGAYVACDFILEALELFRQLIRIKDVEMMILSAVTLATALRACGKLNDSRRGRCLHCYVIKSGYIFDLMVGNTLLSMYAKCAIITDTITFFDEMVLRDSVSYGAIISGCVQTGNGELGLRVFHKMQLAGMKPDATISVSILSACSQLAALQHGSCSHGYAIVHGFKTDVSVCNALIDMYAKCGRINTARKVFDRMNNKDVVSWNSMIIAYGIHGLGKEALSLFDSMQQGGLKPDDVTFISILSACSHSGLVMEGKHLFNAMSQDFHIVRKMEHYTCMVDLLSRAGLFEEVHNFIENMPFDPDVGVWNVLLAACRVHKNVELGEEVSKKIERLGPESTGNFVLLSNMYTSAGRWDDAAQVRIIQKERGFKKNPGCSWIEIGGVVHAFVGGDRSHPQIAQISNKLDELLVEIKKLGYQAESSFVLQDVEEEEKERALLYHSEKLAIAFGILSLSPNKPLLVTKNLRMCGDCHTAIKLISLLTKRIITVRDTSRFHHFKDGMCNCGDFW